MKLTAQIRVMNNTTLGFDYVEAEADGYSFDIKLSGGRTLELDRKQVEEFLARTCLSIKITKQFGPEPPTKI